MFELPWQDIVFFVGNLVFFVALLPSILSSNKPSFWTCVMTAPTLSVFSATFTTLEMNLSAIGIGVGALCWWILFYQTFPRKAPIPITKSD